MARIQLPKWKSFGEQCCCCHCYAVDRETSMLVRTYQPRKYEIRGAFIHSKSANFIGGIPATPYGTCTSGFKWADSDKFHSFSQKSDTFLRSPAYSADSGYYVKNDNLYWHDEPTPVVKGVAFNYPCCCMEHYAVFHKDGRLQVAFDGKVVADFGDNCNVVDISGFSELKTNFLFTFHDNKIPSYISIYFRDGTEVSRSDDITFVQTNVSLYGGFFLIHGKVYKTDTGEIWHSTDYPIVSIFETIDENAVIVHEGNNRYFIKNKQIAGTVKIDRPNNAPIVTTYTNWPAGFTLEYYINGKIAGNFNVPSIGTSRLTVSFNGSPIAEDVTNVNGTGYGTIWLACNSGNGHEEKFFIGSNESKTAIWPKIASWYFLQLYNHDLTAKYTITHSDVDATVKYDDNVTTIQGRHSVIAYSGAYVYFEGIKNGRATRHLLYKGIILSELEMSFGVTSSTVFSSDGHLAAFFSWTGVSISGVRFFYDGVEIKNVQLDGAGNVAYYVGINFIIVTSPITNKSYLAFGNNFTQIDDVQWQWRVIYHSQLPYDVNQIQHTMRAAISVSSGPYNKDKREHYYIVDEYSGLMVLDACFNRIS